MPITSNIKQVMRRFNRVSKKQIPFALSQAMNDATLDAKQAEEQALERELQSPTPFTKRAVFQVRASKRKLRTEVGYKRIQAGYLGLQVTGGVRRPKGKALPVPVQARRNKYGNMPRGYLKRELAKGNVFSTKAGDPRTAHLPPGIYRRMKRGAPKMLVAFEPKATYAPRINFRRVAVQAFNKRFRHHFARRLRMALASAR